MKRKSWALMTTIIVFAVLASFVLVTPAIAESVTDPIGDTLAAGPDITKFSAERTETDLIITLTLDSGPANQISAIIEIDVDQNPNTGTASIISTFSPYSSDGLGAECFVFIAPGIPPTAALVDYPFFATDVLTVNDTPNSLTVTVPLSVIGDDGYVNMAAFVGIAGPPTDVAPNGGHLAVNRPPQALATWVGLKVHVDPEGTGTAELNPDGGRLVAYHMGSTVTLTANPAPGYVFDEWSGDLAGNTNPADLNMDFYKNVTAHFAIAPDDTSPDSDDTTTEDGSIQGTGQNCSVVLQIPEGATVLDQAGNPVTDISINAPDSVPPAPQGVSIIGVCNFEPGGTSFSSPATVRMTYDPDTIPPDVPEGFICLAYYDADSGKWIRLPGTQMVNLSNHTITGNIDTLSQIAIVSPWTALR